MTENSPPFPGIQMMNRKRVAAVWLALSGVALVPAARDVVAQTMVCYKKTCLVYPDGSSICEYTVVDCSKVNIE